MFPLPSMSVAEAVVGKHRDRRFYVTLTAGYYSENFHVDMPQTFHTTDRRIALTRPLLYAELDYCNTRGIRYWPYSLPVYTHTFNGPLSGTTQVSRYQKGKTNLDFIGARDTEWQWHQLGHMQICTSLQTDNHASTPPLSFLQAGCPSCRPTNSVKALKEQ